jgi:hypothetical protein
VHSFDEGLGFGVWGLGYRVLMKILRLSSKIGALGGAGLFTMLLEMPALG